VTSNYIVTGYTGSVSPDPLVCHAVAFWKSDVDATPWFRSAVPPGSPTFWYALNENSGLTTSDLSGNGNDSNVVLSEWVSRDSVGRTITPAATTGARTINRLAGTVNFAAAATTLVVTNSLVTATSLVQVFIRTNDATLKSAIAVCGAGSFTIHANAAATAETSVGFRVVQ